MNKEKGKIIVIEGACDSIGKSTQFTKLCERIKNEGNVVINHHFPTYGTFQCALVEKYLNGELGQIKNLSPYLINSLYAIDRAITWNLKLNKLYDEGNYIIFDRYTTSSLIYQSALIEDEEEKIKFIDYIINYEYNLLGIKKPDKVVFLTAPFEVAMKLKKKRMDNEGVSNDIYERDIALMKKVYDSAIFLANYLSWDIVKCNDGDEMRSIDEIHEDVYRLVKNA